MALFYKKPTPRTVNIILFSILHDHCVLENMSSYILYEILLRRVILLKKRYKHIPWKKRKIFKFCSWIEVILYDEWCSVLPNNRRILSEHYFRVIRNSILMDRRVHGWMDRGANHKSCYYSQLGNFDDLNVYPVLKR